MLNKFIIIYINFLFIIFITQAKKFKAISYFVLLLALCPQKWDSKVWCSEWVRLPRAFSYWKPIAVSPWGQLCLAVLDKHCTLKQRRVSEVTSIFSLSTTQALFTPTTKHRRNWCSKSSFCKSFMIHHHSESNTSLISQKSLFHRNSSSIIYKTITINQITII